MLTRQQKEKLVVDCYNQGKTIRDIAEELRMSFRDIGAILKKASGEMEEKRNIKELLSPSAQAYRLFLKDKAPVEVAITLNLDEAETTRYYEEYWDLNHMHELRMVYDEIEDDIMHFLKLYRLSKSANVSAEHVINLLQTSNEYLPLLEQRCKRLRNEIGSLESKRQKLQYLGNQVSVLTKVLEKTRGEMENLHKVKTRLETRLNEIRNSDEYKKIRQIAEEEVTNSLSERKNLLKLTVGAVIESILRDPMRYKILVSSLHNDGRYASSPHYIDMYRAIILDEAQKIFELMARDLTGKIINGAPLTIHPQTM